MISMLMNITNNCHIVMKQSLCTYVLCEEEKMLFGG